MLSKDLFMIKKPWCEINVSGKKVKIDREDRERVEAKSWRITEGTTGRPRVVTSIRTEAGVRSVTLGKFLMKPPKNKQVYCQRFNEGLDYRKQNLIVCTLSERQRLLPKRRVQTSSQYKGVSFQKGNKKWRASLEVNSSTINLGEFVKESEAALAYNKAAKKYFGANAYQNSIGRKKAPR
jgi:AP2 domain